MSDLLRKLALEDGRYAPEAFAFLFESLEHATEMTGRDEAEGSSRHVTGQELLEGMKAFALKLFGPLGGAVWRSWGVNSTLDWGRIVFLLVEHKHLNRQETDTIEDFRDAFDFDEVFDAYAPELPVELGPHAASDEE